MATVGGGGAAPPPAPPSSSLSPLAPPFTADRPPSWSLFCSPFYPGPYGAGRWEDGLASPWLAPEASFDPAFPEGVWHGKHVGSFAGKVQLGSESPNWLFYSYPSVYDEDVVGPSVISSGSNSAPSPLPKANFYPQLVESSINVSSCDAFKGYPANSCSASTQHDPSSGRTNSYAEYSMFKNGYSVGQPVDPYNMGTCFKDQIPSQPMELCGNKLVEVEQFNDKMLGKSNTKMHTSMPVYTFSSKTSLASHSELANENSTRTSSEAEPGFKLKPLALQSPSVFESGLVEPINTIESSSQALEQINFYVDSPCWKGAPVSRRSVFSAAETIDVNTPVHELNDSANLVQDQKHLPSRVAYSEVPPSQHLGSLTFTQKTQFGSLISDVNINACPDFSSSESPVIFPSTQKNLDDACKLGSNCLKDDEMNHNSEACKDRSGGVGIDQNRNSEENEALPLDKEETVVFSIQPVKEGFFANLETDLNPKTAGGPTVTCVGKPSFSGNNTELLVKTINSLSEVLLSSCNDGANELKEQDYELVEFALHNLELLTQQNKKVISSGSFNVSEPKNSGSQDTSLEPFTGEKGTDNITSHGMEGKVNSSSNVSKGDVKDLSKTCMGQAFEKVFEETVSDQEENPEALIYKNLWIKAEASLCSLKYELELARMKIEMESHRHVVKGRSLPMPCLSFMKTGPAFDGGSPLQKAEERSSANLPGRSLPMPCLSFMKTGPAFDGGSPLRKAEERSSANLPGRSLPMPCLSFMKIGPAFDGGSPLRKAEERSSANLTLPQTGAEERRAEEFDGSLLARLDDLKSRIECSDSNLDHQPHLGLIRPCMEAKDSLVSVGESNAIQESLRPKFSDLALRESISKPNTAGGTQNKDRIRIQLHGGKKNMAHSSSVSGDTSAELSNGNSSVGSAFKPYAPVRQKATTDGYASPAYEWEHVLKEDFLL